MNKKRQLLIDTALTLFYSKGINCSGINEVLSLSGVAKNTLYNHFESKEALILAALEQRHQLFIAWLESKIKDATSNQALITQLFTALDDWFHSIDPILGEFRGCFFINSSSEFSDQNSKISLYCQTHKQQIRELIERALPTKNTLLLEAICIMKEGAITTAYVTKNRSVTTECIEVLKKLA